MPSTLRISAAAVATTLAAFAAIWSAMDRPEAMIERSFADAFERLEAPRTAAALHRGPASFDPAHLHLSRLPASAPGLTLGDRMTIAGRSGSETSFEVVEISPLPAAGVNLTLVTAVSVGPAPAHTIRFVMEAGAEPAITRPPAKPHTL